MDRVRSNASVARKSTTCATLLIDIDRAEISKLNALKVEATVVDSALSLASRVCHDAVKALSAKVPPDSLRIHIVQLEAVLRLELPRGPIEPTLIAYAPPPSGSALTGGGSILAPRGIKVNDLRCNAPPIARPGKPLNVDVVLDSILYPTLAEADLGAALETLSTHLVLEVMLLPSALVESGIEESFGGGGPAVVPLSVSSPQLILAERCVRYAVSIPSGAQASSEVVVTRLVFARKISAAATAGIPLRIPLLTAGGLQAPLVLAAPGRVQSTPAASAAGDLFIPTYNSPTVLVYGPNGDALPPIDVGGLGLSIYTRAAAICEKTSTLLLSDFNGVQSRVVALDLRTRALRWATEPSAVPHCCDIAVISEYGVVVLGICVKDAHRLQAHWIKDGRRIPTGAADVAEGNPRFLVCDQATRTVYACAGDGVAAWTWNPTALRLVPSGPVGAAGKTNASRLVAVVPPTIGRHTSHLVVATVDSPELRVLALPSGLLVHTHTLDGAAKVTGIAGEPSGTAFVVRDGSSALVLEWPLPGMPRLT